MAKEEKRTLVMVLLWVSGGLILGTAGFLYERIHETKGHLETHEKLSSHPVAFEKLESMGESLNFVIETQDVMVREQVRQGAVQEQILRAVDRLHP